MSHRAQEARGLIDAVLGLIAAGELVVHPGVPGHLKAARVQLDAVCALLPVASVPPEAQP